MTEIVLKSREQRLGSLVRWIINNTDITSIERGSDTAMLLEGIAEQLARVEISALKILESTDLESLVGSALDKKAESMRIPNFSGGYGRKSSTQTTGPITISSGFEKISTSLYAGKPAPYSGSTTLYLRDGSSFPTTGSIYIGRNSVDRFEGPITYNSLTNAGSFWIMTLDNALTKSHLHSDSVVLAQGGERGVPVGTRVSVKATQDSPAITFSTTKELIIPDGEKSGTVNVVCDQFGTLGNVLAGSITEFQSSPFPGALVTNPTTYRNGRSVESDEDLRQRIRNYPATLSRGTRGAILGAILGAVDEESGRSVQSAIVLDPAEAGDFARVFIDDGTGLEPSFEGQASDIFIQNASGQETRFRTSQFPVSAVSISGSEQSPFVLEDGQSITFEVDGEIETYYIREENYVNINSATAYEVVKDLNSQSNLIGFRTLDGGKRIVATDLTSEAEVMQVYPSDLQNILGLPISEIRTIFVYQNSELLTYKGKTANLETRPYNDWELSESHLEDVRVAVDGVIQTFSIIDDDFDAYQTSIATATIAQWAEVLSTKVAGVKFTVFGNILKWSTWQINSPNGSLQILETKADGSQAGWIGSNRMWQPTESGGKLYDVGDDKDFKFNRFTGEIILLEKPPEGSIIESGTKASEAAVTSKNATSGLFNLSPLASLGSSKLIVGFDGSFSIKDMIPTSTSTFEITEIDAVNKKNVFRLTATDQNIFSDSDLFDYIYLNKNDSVANVIPEEIEGLYQIIDKGNQLVDTQTTNTALTANTNVYTNIAMSVQEESSSVLVFITDHGLKTGDLISVDFSAPGSIGGISHANLSVVDTSIIVLSDHYFTYEALSSATSDATGQLDFLGTNRLLVEHDNHGLQTGSIVNISTATNIQDILAASINGNRTIEFINNDSYYIRADEASLTDGDGTIDTTYYLVDTYVDIQVSDYNYADFAAAVGTNYNITEGMINIFYSSVIPQVIDFTTSVSNLTVDQVISTINSKLSSGKAEKINPRSFRIKSNKLEQDFDSGSCAVLAVIGNASSLFLPEVVSSIQSHTASLTSQKILNGSPVFTGVELPTTNYPTRQYLTIDHNMVNVLDKADSPSIENDIDFHSEYPEGFQHRWITGRGYNYTARVYNNQTTQPYTGVMTTEHGISPIGVWDSTQNSSDNLDRYSNIGMRFRDLSFSSHDNLVVEMDLNPADNTVSIPMYKRAKIQNIDSISGSGKGQVISFRLKDPDDSDKPFFDSDSIYKNFSLVDFKILLKSTGLYKLDSDRAIILRSASFGGNSQLRFSIRYPAEASLATPVITHTNDYYNDKTRTNLIFTLPSKDEVTDSALLAGSYRASASVDGSIYKIRFYSGYLNNNNTFTVGNVLNIGGSGDLSNSYKIIEAVSINETNLVANTTAGSNVISITLSNHGLQTGDLINVSTSTNIGGIPAASLSLNNALITVLNVNTFTYQALESAVQINASNVPAAVINGSATVTVTIPDHGLETNDLITVSTGVDIGGILAADLSVSNAAVTVLTQNTFTYEAATNATSTENGTLDTLTSNAGNDSGLIGAIQAGVAVVHAPSDGGITSPATYDASKNPIRTWEIEDITIDDVVGFINLYLVDSPIVTAEAIGTDTDTINLTEATYIAHPSSLTSGDMSAAFLHHSFDCYSAGYAGIWQYDSSDENVNGIKATVQHPDPVFPTITDASGTSYNPINEEVLIVPTNTNTLREWINFKGITTVNLLAEVEKIESDSELQIASKTFGSSGAVKITGVNANAVSSQISGNASFLNDSVRLKLLTSEAQSLMKHDLVKVQNTVATDITREYKLAPSSVAEETTVNTSDINNYFRESNSIRYVRLDTNKARIIFIRDGAGLGQNEPLEIGNTITFTDLSNGLVRVTSAQGAGSDPNLGKLLARTGDMMYIQPGSVNFPTDCKCKKLLDTGLTDEDDPEYLGYPVIKVEDEYNILILAPNISSFGTYSIADPTELVFIPAIWNEKNIQTNHKAGALFDQLYNNNICKYIIKSLGNGLVTVIVQNSDNEATDDLLLDNLMVNTDDFAYFGEEFDLANQGTFRIIAHNGRNMMLIYNPDGGQDEIVTEDSKWTGGSLNDGFNRSLRIIAANSVRIGDYLRISTPSNLSQWFNNTLIGSWQITGIGLIGQSFNSGDLPYTESDGSVDVDNICPFIDVVIPNAPAGIVNSSGDYIDSFSIGNNTSSIGFTEANPFTCYRVVQGREINSQDPELSDVFLKPTISYTRLAQTFGTIVTSLNKIGYDDNVKQGIDGYKYYTGLIRKVHRIIDGIPNDVITYQGVRAAGSLIQVDVPLLRSIKISLQVKPKDGVTLNSISELVQSTAAGYINGLGTGKPVIISEIIRVVQSIPGVYSVEVVDSEAVDDRIVVSDIEKAYVLNSSTDISVG